MLLSTLLALTAVAPPSLNAAPGQLVQRDKEGKIEMLCPLEGTSVNADVAGFGARVTVVQTFTNPSKTPIEAVYTFPLPADAAVDKMRIKVGTRVIEGVMKRREEARRIYDAAKSQGQTAALLDQERQNIFTQSVANITPGAKVKVEISYSQILPYEHGQFEFQFPMVVGPRYLGNAADPGKISPPITPEGTRTGANIDLAVHLQAGAKIQSTESILHEIVIEKINDSSEVIHLTKRDEIPNRDFILRYKVATNQVQSGFIAHTDPEKGGFFSLVLLPPQVPVSSQIAPREVVFVMDQSGSQSGFPIQKSIELTHKLIHNLRPNDTFNVLAFSNEVHALWPTARPNTPANVAEADRYIGPMTANGGTELCKAVIAALEPADDPNRIRLIVFNTDGFVGDEKGILDAIQKHRRNSRVFTFGIGNSVNHFLIDGMSAEGCGDSETVTLAESADPAVQRFLDRTQTPVLTNIEAHVVGGDVTDMLPGAIPDVFAGKPVVLYGRFAGSGPAKIVITAKLGGRPWSQTVDVNFPVRAQAPALMGLWARRRVDDLTRANWLGQFENPGRASKVEEITDTALEFGIMTEYTSFVAVEPRVVNVGGKMRTVRVPVEMADGVSYRMGSLEDRTSTNFFAAPSTVPLRTAGGAGGGFGGGSLSAKTNNQGSGGRGTFGDYDSAKALSPEELRKANVETKIQKKLRSAKGTIEIQIFFSKLDDAVIKTIKDLGVTADVVDGKLRLILGTCDAKILEKLAQVEAIDRVEALGE